jgi:hypothetical protein
MPVNYTNLYAVPKDSFDQYLRHKSGNFGNVKNIRVQQLNINEADEIYPTQNGPPVATRRRRNTGVTKANEVSDNLTQVNVTPPGSPKPMELAPPTPYEPVGQTFFEPNVTRIVPESPEPMDTTPALTDAEILEHTRQRENRFPYSSTPVAGIVFPGGQTVPGFTPARLSPVVEKSPSLNPISAESFYGTKNKPEAAYPFFASTPISKRQRFAPTQGSSFVENFPERAPTTPSPRKGKKRKREPETLRKRIVNRQLLQDFPSESPIQRRNRLMDELGAALDSAEAGLGGDASYLPPKLTSMLRESTNKMPVPRLFTLAERALPVRIRNDMNRGIGDELARTPVARRLQELEARLKQISSENSRVDKGTSISRKLEFTDEEEMDQQEENSPAADDWPLLDSKGRLPLLIKIPPVAKKRGNTGKADPSAPKRPRGRPRIYYGPVTDPDAPKRPRGRPRKNPENTKK